MNVPPQVETVQGEERTTKVVASVEQEKNNDEKKSDPFLLDDEVTSDPTITVRTSNHHRRAGSGAAAAAGTPSALHNLFKHPTAAKGGILPNGTPQHAAAPTTGTQSSPSYPVDTVSPASSSVSASSSTIPRPRPIHRRGISWDTDVKAPASMARPPRRHGRSISTTLQDVTHHHPLEAEAETLLMSALEEQQMASTSNTSLNQPGRPRLNTTGSVRTTGVLPHVPVAAEAVFTDTDDDDNHHHDEEPSVASSKQQQDGATAAVHRHHRRQKTIEQRLDGLSDALEAIHSGGGIVTDDASTIESKTVGGGGSIGTGGGGTGSMDSALHQVANVLIQRRKRADSSVTAGNNTLQQAHLDSVYVPQNIVAKNKKPCGDVETGGDRTDSLGNGGPNDGGDNGSHGSGDESRNDGESSLRRRMKNRRKKTRARACLNRIPLLRELLIFLSAQGTVVSTFVMLVVWVMIPATALAAVLFYVAGNPPTGRIDRVASANSTFLINHYGEKVDPDQPSASWWLLYLGGRQMVTLTLARATQFFLVDFLCIGRRWTSRYLGPVFTLLIVQARGWPFVLTWWSMYNFGLNTGENEFAAHWLYLQDRVGLFNEENPSGNLMVNPLNFRICAIALCVGVVVSVKRTWIGFFLGRKTYVYYAADLAKVMKTIILVSKVATLSKSFDTDMASMGSSRSLILTKARENVASLVNESSIDEEEASDSLSIGNATKMDTAYVVDPDEKDTITGGLTEQQRTKITRLLGAWEEPEKASSVEETVSVRAILKFRQSLTFLDTPFIFSYAFGRADTREHCIESAQDIFLRLLQGNSDSELLSFDVIAMLALRADGTFHTAVLKDLISLLRPDREGNISLIDFVKSIDGVYRKVRLLRAAVRNSQKIDQAFELIVNVVFYSVLTCVVLSQLGFDPLALFLSLSSIIVAFAFMIGTASAKYFEGILFILIQKPYDIGDRINIEPPSSPGQTNGSVSWLVKDVSLFTTTILLNATNETATVSNGCLASCRIINGARSPTARLYVYLKFGIEVPYEQIELFYDTLSQFIRARPREWLSLVAFMSTNIQTDQGFIEYKVVLQHRHSWQEPISLELSLAQVQSFCMELSKKLDMRYKSPSLPVSLSLESNANSTADKLKAGLGYLPTIPSSEDLQKIVSKFSDGGL